MIWFPCDKACKPGADQYSWRENGDTAHTYVSSRVEPGTEAEIYCVECGNCGQRYEIGKELWDEASQQTIRKSSMRKAGLTKYPYVDPYSGETVKSKEHREEVWKAHGLHKAEHGVNESFDDEACDSLRRKRQAIEARRLAVKRKRDDYVKQGIMKPKIPQRA